MNAHTIRATALALALAALALAPAASATPVAHHPAPADHGCSLYVSVPNPCDPPSAN